MASAAMVTVPSAYGLRAVPRPVRVLTVDGNQLVQEGLASAIMALRADHRLPLCGLSGPSSSSDDYGRRRERKNRF